MSGQVHQMSDIVGREALLEQLIGVVSKSDLVISGPAGVGKTTLAREIAKSVGDAPFCDLTNARSREDFVATVSRTLGLEPRAGSSVTARAQRVADAIVERGIELLVLDNFDHVIEHSDVTMTWSCRKVLTSRAPVPMVAAAQFAVEPLDEDAAMRLFELRAAVVAPGFAIDPQNAPVVRELVQRLDRLPLPIELAAARSRVLRPEQILQRMEERLATLTDQQTGRSLGSALEWTWDLLSGPEQYCLMQCTVFRGAFTFEEAESVVRLEGVAVLDAIDRLVAAGWLRARRDPATGMQRFSFFESVHDFVAPRLSDDERRRLERAHAMHLTRWAIRLASSVEGRDGVRAFKELTTREDALRWASELWLSERRVEALELLNALTYPILLHSRIHDWADVVDQGCRLAEEHDLSGAVRLQVLRGQMHLLTRKLPAAEETLRRARALADQVADGRLVIRATRALAIAVASRDPGSASQMLEGALNEVRHSSDEFVVARILERLGFAYNRMFRLDAAYDAFEESHDLLLRVSNPLFGAEPLAGMGYVAWRRGHLSAARDAFARAVDLHRQAGNRAREAGARFNLGAVLHALGELDAAANEFEQAEHGWSRLGLPRYRPAVVVKRALLACERGDPTDGRRLAQRARGEASQRNDSHNAALADGVIAFTRIFEGRAIDRPALEYTLATLNMGADPIAVGAHLAMLAGTAPDPAVREHLYNRIDEVRSLASQQDVHVDESLLVIDRLARAHGAIVDYLDRGERAVLGVVRGARQLSQTGAAVRSPYTRLLSAWLEKRCAAELAGVDLSGQRQLTVHPDAHWFQVDDDEVVELTTRKPLRLLLRHFVQLSRTDPLAGAAVTDLIGVGWPGEHVSESAGKNRVYTAIRFLREMGLEDILVTSDAGYRLSPDIVLDVSEARP